MAIHLFMSEISIGIVQSSGGGLSYAEFGFFSLLIIDNSGNESGSLLSPSIVMAVLLCVNIIFLSRHRFARPVVLNIALLTASLVLYHMFLHDLNSALELAVHSNSLWLNDLGLFGYEFYDNVEKTVFNGYNYTILPLIISMIYNASKLVSRN
jgi:hypothetical protein